MPMDYEKCCFILNACRFSLSILFSVADQSGSAENDNTQQHHISLASELLSLRVTTEGNGRRVNMVYGHPKVRICLYIFLKSYCGVVIHLLKIRVTALVAFTAIPWYCCSNRCIIISTSVFHCWLEGYCFSPSLYISSPSAKSLSN